MACVAVNSLVRTIEIEFLQPHPRQIVQEKELISCNKELIQSLHQKLGFLIELFDERRMDSVEAIKHLETKLRDVAFKVEDEVELLVVNLYQEEEEEKPQGDIDSEKTCHSCKLHHILEQAIEDIDAIKEELVKVKMECESSIALQGRKTKLAFTKCDDEVNMMGDSPQHASHSQPIMVGKKDEFHTIKEMLIEHPSRQREIVSIKGMGGIGKTTLARRVYEDPAIVSHFDKQAWVVASQHHNKLQMLLGLLKSLGCKVSDKDTEGDLAERLYQKLMHQRYFIVIDDVWSDEAWIAVQSSFPDNGNRSRVLLTTRVAEVATHIGSNNDFSHQMQLLDESESWNLFRQKACKSRGAEFETIGRPIVEKCKGLPLAIVVVAGLFSKLDTLDEWEKIADETLNLSTRSTIDKECSKILSLSYNHLPYNLKACFLYLGVFPEDEEINAKNIARLWASEGLVEAFKNESFEAVGRRYIKELMDRNLILVSQSSCCGRKIKAFRVHDLLHAFCVNEAQNQSLLHVADESGSNSPQKGVRWVRIQSEGFDISELHSCSKNCRSIFYFLSRKDPSFLNLKIFNLGRVVYFTKLEGQMKLDDLVHLRYLSTDRKSSHGNVLLSLKAWNLQTLGMNVSGICFGEFPKLQDIYCRRFYEDSRKFLHQNLRSIFTLEPKHCTEEFLRKVGYLKKVSIRGERNACIECTKNLVCLQQLERLSIYVDLQRYTPPGMVPFSNNILLLKNLKKLTFYAMNFEWKSINALSKLPRLEVLKLIFCHGSTKWELPENEKFCHLICLKIWRTNLRHWIVSATHFPKLERLLLSECDQLREIPNSFAEISTLNLIELRRCSTSTVMSAYKIRDEQHDYGNENMVVIEKPYNEKYSFITYSQ